MSMNTHYGTLGGIVLCTLLLMLCSSGVSAQVKLRVELDSAVVFEGDTAIAMDVIFDNPEDVVAGFAMQMTFTNPDLVYFGRSPSDTIAWDTIGTLINNFELIETSMLGTGGSTFRILGLGNWIEKSPYIAPQEGGTLFRLLFHATDDIHPLSQDSTTDIVIITQPINAFGFSDPYGDLIGVVFDTLVDTSWWQCTEWTDTVCTGMWIPSDPENGDSMEVDTSVTASIDTASVITYNGFFDVRPYVDGDANGDGAVNVGDAILVVNFVFKAGPPPVPSRAGDANCDEAVNIGDAIHLINFIFKSGPPPGC